MSRKAWLAMLCVAFALSAVGFRLGGARAIAGQEGNPMQAESRAAQGAPSPTIENCVREFVESAATKTDQGWQFWFVPAELSPTFNFKMTQVGPQSANHPPHSHPEEEIYFVFEGRAEFFFDGQRQTVGPNAAMFCPSGVPHGIRNAGDAPLRYAVIKANYPEAK